MAQELEEFDRVPSCGGIEAQSSRARRGKVGEMTLAGTPDEAVGEDLPLGDSPRIGRYRVISGRSSHGPCRKTSNGSAGALSPTRMRVRELGVMPSSAAILTMMSTCLFATAT